LSRRALLTLVVAAFLHGLVYAVLTPPWQAPDEIAHFEYAHLLAQHGRPVTLADASPELEREIIGSLYRHRAWDYLFRPAPEVVPERLAYVPAFGASRTLSRFSLAYVPYALAAMPLLGQSVEVKLYAMRLVSAVIGALVLVVAVRTAALVEPEAPALALGVTLFILCLPQHAYVMGTVSDGNLAELLASVTLYQWASLLQGGFTWQRTVLSVLCGLLALLTKATAYFLAPLGIVVALVLVVRRHRVTAWPTSWLSRQHLLRTALVLGAVIVPILPLAFLPVISTPFSAILMTVVNNLKQVGGFVPHLLKVAFNGQLRLALLGTFTSYWGTFGWMAVPLPRIWYWLLGAACALSAVGWLRQRKTRPPELGRLARYAFIALAALLPIAVLVAWFATSSIGIYAYQGRYLFGGVVPLALLIVRGWLFLAPGARSGQMLWGIAIGLVLLDTSALFLVMVPFFYGCC
jgi:hypothetical protein